jgi:hypothetical protein
LENIVLAKVVPFIILFRKIRAWHPGKAKQLLGEASWELK